MRFKTRKVCIWIVFIQILFMVINLNFYNSIADVKNLTSKWDDWYGIHTPPKILKSFGTLNRLSLAKEVIWENQIRRQSRVETKPPRSSIGTTVKVEIVPKQKEKRMSEGIYNKTVISEKRKGRPVYSNVRKCAYIEFPEHLDQGERWQPVDKRTAFVFSAYFVERGKMIVINGARTKHRQNYFCHIWKKKNGTYSAEQVSASVKQLPEGRSLWYSAVFFECSLSSYSGIPSHVSLVTKHCASPSNILQVRITTKPDNYPRRFTVCLTPLNSQYNRAYELVEWIELNRIIGAEKFVIYNHSSSENVLTVLEFYKKQGLVEVVQWQLPMEVRTFNDSKPAEIHYFGQIIALQDCLYRNKMDSKFVVNIDLDEFIIPRGDNINNWNDMLKPLDNSSGAYIVRNTFFRKEWESVYLANKELVDKYGLVTLKKLHHEENIFPAKRRSKYFARTETVFQVMIHDVIHLPMKNRAEKVPIEIGRLHHYRDWENDIKLPDVKVFDDTVPRKFGAKLIENVRYVWSKQINVQMNIPAHL